MERRAQEASSRCDATFWVSQVESPTYTYVDTGACLLPIGHVGEHRCQRVAWEGNNRAIRILFAMEDMNDDGTPQPVRRVRGP